MTRYRVIVQPPARRDMEAAFLWIAERNPAAAIRWLAGLEAAIQSLATVPERSSLAPESEVFNEQIRQLIYGRRTGRYRVLFTVMGGRVRVLHVRHGARLPLGAVPLPGEYLD